MTAAESDTGKPFENPLMPNARLRQIYLAMVRVRLLEEALAAGPKRGLSGVRGLEACLVSTAVDLGLRDVLSDTVGGGAVDFLRGATLESVLRPEAKARKSDLKAECGAAIRLLAGPGVEQRIWMALGAAAALKAERVRADAESAAQAGVAVVYARSGEISAAMWRGALAYAAKELLPVLFVVLPGAAKATGLKPGKMSELAHGCGIPGIPVDAQDAVAMYRVAQEAVGRARAGGGAALMECVPFALEGKSAAKADAIAGLEAYMLPRKVATRSWMEREAHAFAKRAAR